MKRKTSPRNLLSGRRLGQITKPKLGPTTVNLGILGTSVVLSLVAFQYKETPIGATLLGAAGSIAAVAFVFFIRELLIGPGEHCPTTV